MTFNTSFIEANFTYINQREISYLNPVIELSLKGLNPEKAIIVKKTIQLSGIIGRCFDFLYSLYHSHQWVKITFKKEENQLAVWIKVDDLSTILNCKKDILLNRDKPIEELINKHFKELKANKFNQTSSEILFLKKLLVNNPKEQKEVSEFLEKYKILEKCQSFQALSDNDTVSFKTTKRMQTPLNTGHTKAELRSLWKDIALNQKEIETSPFRTINKRNYYIHFSSKVKSETETIEKLSVFETDKIEAFQNGSVCKISKVIDLAKGKWMIIRQLNDFSNKQTNQSLSNSLTNLLYLTEGQKCKGIQGIPTQLGAFKSEEPTSLLQYWAGMHLASNYL